jgi:thioesterase domain-containing protein
MYEVPGDHFTILRPPHVSALAGLITHHLDLLEPRDALPHEDR